MTCFSFFSFYFIPGIIYLLRIYCYINIIAIRTPCDTTIGILSILFSSALFSHVSPISAPAVTNGQTRFTEWRYRTADPLVLPTATAPAAPGPPRHLPPRTSLARRAVRHDCGRSRRSSTKGTRSEWSGVLLWWPSFCKELWIPVWCDVMWYR